MCVLVAPGGTVLSLIVLTYQQVKMLVLKTEVLSSVPGPHLVEGKTDS